MPSTPVPVRPRAWLRVVALTLLGLYVVARLRNVEHWDLLDDLDLAVHEAGHLVFQPLGDHPMVIGGSLFQVMVPLTFVAYFAFSRQAFASSVTLAWAGVNLLDVARYIGDARARDLPLLGGENSVHDWWYLLTEWDALPYDTAIARWVRLAGACAMLLALAAGTWFAWRDREAVAVAP
jgi:hypothetical protein